MNPLPGANHKIKEALIEFKCARSVDVESLERTRTSLEDRFGKAKKLREATLLFSLSEEGDANATSTGGLTGYRFDTEDPKEVRIIRRDSVVVSEIDHYTDWETLTAKIQDLWAAWDGANAFTVIERIGARYINVISPGTAMFDADDFLAASPKIPESLPQTFEGFFQQVTIPFADRLIRANIQQTIQSRNGSEPVLILDIDVSTAVSTDIKDLTLALKNIRDIKNTVFANYITPKVSEMVLK